jgi:protocatechuate 3,4-dioxygenase, alpha subunit
VIHGQIFAGDGQPINDAMIEAWAPGALAVPGLPSLLRTPSGAQGEFSLQLPPPAPGEPAAYITVFARGLLVHQFTAVFLSTDSPLLAQVPMQRRATLLAQPEGAHWRWDIHLQGTQETVFFDYV